MIVPILVVGLLFNSITIPDFSSISSVPAAGALINALTKMPETRYENTIFWPAVTAISVILMLRNGSRLARPALPPHIIWFARIPGVRRDKRRIWAFSPEGLVLEILHASDDGLHPWLCQPYWPDPNELI